MLFVVSAYKKTTFFINQLINNIMKKRITKWLKYFFVRYIPTTNHIAPMEAKRLCQYIIENYDENAQLVLLEDLKNNLIEYRKKSIILQEEEIENSIKKLKQLNNNLLKLTV
jgi:hypothetical protein